MPSRAYWGGFGRGLSSGINDAFKMQLQMEEHKLKARMLEHQMKKTEMEEQEKLKAAQQRESMASQLEAPTMEPSGWKIYTQDETSPQFGQEPPPGETTNYAPLSPLAEDAMVQAPASLRNRLLAAQIRMGKSIPSEAFKDGTTGGSAFATPKDAIAFQNSPEFKQLYPNGYKTNQTSRGFAFEGMNPVNAAMNEYHRVLAEGGTKEQAAAAMQAIIFGNAATQSAGTQLGGAAATLNQPIPAPPPFAGNTTPPVPGQVLPPGPAQPQPSGAPTASPIGTPRVSQNGGKSLPILAAEAKAGASVTGKENAEMALPLREKALNYINPDDLTTAPPHMTENEALAKGYRAFNGNNSGQYLSMARSAYGILDRLETLSKKLLLPKSAGLTERGKNWMDLQRRALIGDPDVKEFFGLMGSQLATFAKAAGDAANIAVPEQQFQKEFLPGAKDSLEGAIQTIQSRRALLRGTLDGALGVKPVPNSKFPGESTNAPQPLQGEQPKTAMPAIPIGTIRKQNGKTFKKTGPGDLDWEEVKDGR